VMRFMTVSFVSTWTSNGGQYDRELRLDLFSPIHRR